MTGRSHLSTPVSERRPTRRSAGAAVLVVALAMAAGCSQQDPKAATAPKASAVIPTDAAVTTSAPSAPTTSDAPVRTIEDVRSTLTADGTLDVNQADCVLGNLQGALPEAEVIKAFAAQDLASASAPQRTAVIKAFTTCVPKEVLVRPVGLSVQQIATSKGVTVGNAEVDCIAKQLAAAVTYEDLLSPPSDGSGGLPDATATQAVKACVAADAYSALGLGG